MGPVWITKRLVCTEVTLPSCKRHPTRSFPKASHFFGPESLYSPNNRKLKSSSLQADLYSYARTKLIRLADVVGRRSGVELSPCNSAALSMSPWPRPAVWPSLPADGEARAAVREQENHAGKFLIGCKMAKSVEKLLTV